jgi:TonB family protein
MSAKPPKTPPTPRERTQNFLLYGFALSILIHLLIGPLVQFKRTPEAPEKIETVKIDKMPTPPPTPKPTPKPTPTPPPTPPPKETPPPKPPPPQQQQIKINTLKTKGSTTGTEESNTHTSGSENGAPQGTASAAAAPTQGPVATPAPPPPPTPTPTPSCAVPNADARTINAAHPETPAIAQQQGITGEVVVQVTLDVNSKVTEAHVIKSPSVILNKAAIAAAQQSTFKTRIANCQPVSESYNFIVDFTSE